MAYQVKAHLVLVRVPGVGDDYRIDYHYLGINENIPWLSDQQRQQFLSDGLVEEIPEPGPTSQLNDVNPVHACVTALDQLGLPASCGAPTVRDALRGAGHRFGNDVIAAAVKARKATSDAVPDSPELARS